MIFEENSNVADNFDSVLKCFRIMQPNVIDLENRDLEDEHFTKLLNFMKNTDMITSLNMRKNKIRNIGAHAFADFITEHDQTLIEVDLNRNRIEEDGAQSLIDAIHKTIRIEKFEMGFGNLISPYLVNAFDQELLSNQQIKDNL